MRRTLAALLLVAAAIVLAALPAGATSANGTHQYASTTTGIGMIECAWDYAEIGEALAPDTLYVKAQTYSTYGAMCGGGNLDLPWHYLAVQYRVMAYGPFGAFPCRDWTPLNYNPFIIDYHIAKYDQAFPGCGDFPYNVQVSSAALLLDGGNYRGFSDALATFPVYLNG